MNTPNSVKLRLVYSVVFCFVAIPVSQADAGDVANSDFFDDQVVPSFQEHCVRCHNAKEAEAGFALHDLCDDFVQGRETWAKILQQIESGEMPPEQPLLDEQERVRIAEWIKSRQAKVDWSSHQQAGHVTLPRLTLNEYANTLRDLFKMPNINPARTFTDEGVGDTGFSTDRDALHLDASKLEKYLDSTTGLLDDYFSAGLPPESHTVQGINLHCTNAVHTTTTWGKILKNPRDVLYFQHRVKRSGWYLITTKAWGYRPNNRECAALNLYVNSSHAGRSRLLASERDPGYYKTLIWLDKGSHTIRFNPVRSGVTEAESKLPLSPYYKGKLKYAIIDPNMAGSLMAISDVSLKGPLSEPPENARLSNKDRSALVRPPKRGLVEERTAEELAEVDKEYEHTLTKVPVDQPIPPPYSGEIWMTPRKDIVFQQTNELEWAKSPFEGRKAAKEILDRFLFKAFRRPLQANELDKYLALYDAGVSSGDSHVESLKMALAGVLVSPQFLYRVPSDDVAANESTSRGDAALNSYEMASRLSYFLWQSMPDDELFELASRDLLTSDEQILDQFRRMLKDPRSQNMTSVFAREWLRYRELGITIVPDPETHKQYTPALQQAMLMESELYVDHVFRNNRSILEFIDSHYSFINQDLAAHYGIEGVRGSTHKQVKLPEDSPRGGLLGMGSILTVTSHPNRTSAVDRGLWVLNTLLGQSLPDPPAVVPPLEENEDGEQSRSFREILETHRSHKQCLSCHNKIDPIGFGLENFDAIGKWRDKDAGHQIDASGILPGGETFDGPRGLRKVLIARKGQFTRALSSAMLAYALGRELKYYDKPAIDKIVTSTVNQSYSAQSLLEAVVTSYPFRHKNLFKDSE